MGDNSKTIFLNGISGFLTNDKTMQPTYELFNILSRKKAFKMVCGGDSVAAVIKSGYASNFDYLSSGGGATLAFLSGTKMIGLEPFIKK